MSAIASAFVDNIPLTTMMVKIAISLAEKKALNLPLQPLVWALAFGACLGGLLISQSQHNNTLHSIFSNTDQLSYLQVMERWLALRRMLFVRVLQSNMAIDSLSLNISSECCQIKLDQFTLLMNPLVSYFHRVGFPVMIGSVIVATFYLMFAHVFLTWH